MPDLITRIDRLVVVTSADEATDPIDQARKHRDKVRTIIARERRRRRGPGDPSRPFAA